MFWDYKSNFMSLQIKFSLQLWANNSMVEKSRESTKRVSVLYIHPWDVGVPGGAGVADRVFSIPCSLRGVWVERDTESDGPARDPQTGQYRPRYWRHIDTRWRRPRWYQTLHRQAPTLCKKKKKKKIMWHVFPDVLKFIPQTWHCQWGKWEGPASRPHLTLL